MTSILCKLHNNVINKLINKRNFLTRTMSTVDSFSKLTFEDMENHLKKYEGGKISLSKKYWHEGIALLNIDNPAKRNAISGKMMVDFRECVAELEQWKEGKGVLLQGLGENFCSGGDLEFAKATGNPEGAYMMTSYMHDILTRLRALPLLSVCLVHGPALGGGAEISIACDHLLVTNNVRFGFVHGTMGIITAWGATTRLVQLLGERKALDVLLKADIMSADQTVQLGIASQVVDTDNREEEALKFLRERTKFHYSVVRGFKTAAYAAGGGEDLKSALDVEKMLLCPLWGGELNREALARNIKHVKKGDTIKEK